MSPQRKPTRSKAGIQRNTNEKRGSHPNSRANLIPLKTGFDPRRNVNGRPKSFDQLRELVREIGEQELTAEGLTRIAAKVMMMYSSKNSLDTSNLLAYGWGKVPQPIEIGKLSDTELTEFITQQIEDLGVSVGGSEEAQPVPDAAGEGASQ